MMDRPTVKPDETMGREVLLLSAREWNRYALSLEARIAELENERREYWDGDLQALAMLCETAKADLEASRKAHAETKAKLDAISDAIGGK